MFRRIYNLIIDFVEYVVLLILLITSMALLISNDNANVRSFQAEVTSFFKFLHYPNKWINTVSGLVKENNQLEQENTQLKLLIVQFKEAWLENVRLKEMLGFQDTISYEIIPAKVLNKGTTPIFNSILIDGGKNIGIEPGKAVITNRGIVGKTVSVGESSTTIHLINDVNFRLGVRLQESRHIGILEPMNDHTGLLNEIPKTVSIKINEQVLTSGFSDIFPKGFPVGEVIEIHDIPNSIYKNVVLKFFVDVNRVEEVFVIKGNK